MIRRLYRAALVAPLALLAATACGGDHGPTQTQSNEPAVSGPPGARAEFSAFPVDMTADGTIEPLGHLAPSPHTLPTDHVYFYPINYDRPQSTPDVAVRRVYSPAAGTVSFILTQSGADSKVAFVVTRTFGYYLDHIIPRAGLKVGTIVQPGEAIGTTNPGGAIDLGAWDDALPALSGFANPTRYGDMTLHCVNPFRYFVEPLRTTLYARQRRATSAAAESRIDFDVAGRLIGNWFESTLPVTMDASMGPAGCPKQIAFVYDNFDPSKVRISIGGTVSAQGLWTIPADAPRPETISVASGKVAYRLMYTESTNVQAGLMLVQMLADDRVRIEVFEGSQAATADFDGRAFTYIR